MSKIYPRWIDEYVRSVHKLLTSMDLRTIEPLDCFHFHPLYSELWLDYIYRAVNKFKHSNFPFKMAVKVFPNPSSVRAMLVFLMVHYHNIVLDKKEVDESKVREVFNFFIKVLKAKNHRDIFAYQENICHSQKEISQLIKKVKWQDGTPVTSHALGKLYLGASTLINGLMNDWCTDCGLDVWGPYKLSKKYGPNPILVIRDFNYLQPAELWSATHSHGVNHITVYAIYNNVEMKVGYFGCHTVFKGDLAKNLIKYAIRVGGKFLYKFDEIEKLSQNLIKSSAQQYQRVRNLSFEALKQKIIQQEFFQLKSFFQLVGLDYHPPKSFYDQVKNKKLLKGRYPLDTQAMPFKQIDERFGINTLRDLYS